MADEEKEDGPASRMPPRSRLTLERVLGITALSNAMMAVNPATGELAYAAGCIVVIYNLRRNKQVRYYRVEKVVSSICFSPTGQYLAIGEKGYMPSITIWDGTNGTLCVELARHRYGVACMAFSRDCRYLMTVGLIHDQQLHVWDLQQDVGSGRLHPTLAGAATIREKVLAMDYCLEGNFFVTVGEEHFKFWFLDSDDQLLFTGETIEDIPEIQHRDAVIGANVEKSFSSVACGHGICRLKTFAVTIDGTLCCFGASGIMERLVSLETSRGCALSVTESYVAVGGSFSVARLFDPATLEYRATLPFPPALGCANELVVQDQTVLVPRQRHRYPVVAAIRMSGSYVAVLYGDKSLFIFDITDVLQPQLYRSFIFHSGAVRCLRVAGHTLGVNGKGKLVYDLDSLRSRAAKNDDVIPCGTIISCADDNTVRLWHLDLHKASKTIRQDEHTKTKEDNSDKKWKNPYSTELLRVIYHNTSEEFEDPQFPVLGGTCSSEAPTDIHSSSQDPTHANSLRCLALHPDGREIAAGDKEGKIAVFILPKGEVLAEIDAHTGEVQCLDYSKHFYRRAVSPLMVSGGRDRLVHIYACGNHYEPVKTAELHSSGVTSLRFLGDDQESKRLVSGGADKQIVITEVNQRGEMHERVSISNLNGKLYDVESTPHSDGRLLVLSNNRLEIFNASTGKSVKIHHVGEQHRLAVCPAGICVAMSGSLADKTINLIEIDSGDTIAEATGHGEAITGIEFTPDCRRLVTSSADGCIFVWRLAEDIQSLIKSNLPRVADVTLMPPPVPVSKSESIAHPTPIVMPPPAPPRPPASMPSNTQSSSAGPKMVLEPAAPKSIDDPSKAGMQNEWKGRVKAVPGPMADIPMEDWMKTRENALPKDPQENEESSLNGAEISLRIDREQTPAWARTVKYEGGEKDSEPASAPVVGGKWATRAPQSQRHSGSGRNDEGRSRVQEKVFVRSSQRSATASSQNISSSDESGSSDKDVSSHSQERLVVTDFYGKHSSMNLSLAQEREVLERKRKQEETARAVAEMNSKLAELGLLKPKGKNRALVRDRPLDQKEDGSAFKIARISESKVVQPVHNSAPSDEKRPGKFRTQADDIPEEMLSSMTKTSDREQSKVPSPGLISSVDLTSAQKTEASKTHKRASSDGNPMKAVDSSLSCYTSGYMHQQSVHHLAVQDPSQRGAACDSSLSVFTAGFSDKKEGAVHSRSVSDISVQQSASAFVNGYMVQGDCHAENSQEANWSNGHVNESLSQFTPGYTSNKSPNPPPDTSSSQVRENGEDSSIPVAHSLSVFTSGYSENSSDKNDANAQPAVYDKVDASLSLFTSGYGAARGESSGLEGRKSPPKGSLNDNLDGSAGRSSKLSLLSILSTLDQQLTSAATQLAESIPTPIEDDNSSDLLDVQSSIQSLRTQIELLVSKRSRSISKTHPDSTS